MPNPNEYLAQLTALAQEQRDAVKWLQEERAKEWERARGVKLFRLPVLRVIGANPLNIPADQPPGGLLPVTPDQGYMWSLKRLVVTGMTRTATPDILQVLRGTEVVWELNGNQYAQTWGTGEMEFKAGEALGFQSVGTFASTSLITIRGAAWQVPAEMEWKLL